MDIFILVKFALVFLTIYTVMLMSLYNNDMNYINDKIRNISAHEDTKLYKL